MNLTENLLTCLRMFLVDNGSSDNSLQDNTAQLGSFQNSSLPYLDNRNLLDRLHKLAWSGWEHKIQFHILPGQLNPLLSNNLRK